MSVARNTVNKFEARVASGRGESLIIFTHEGFLIERVVVGIKPELRNFVRGTATGIR